MKNKRIFKTFSALCAALVLMMGLSVTAFAQGTEQPPAEDATNDENVVVEKTEDSPALTPEGNAALVDDFGGNKQLITVTTKAGNYFYILIDRANEDKETAVHFLNQVDEADLMALMEDGQSAEKPPVVCNCTEKCEAGAVNTKCEVCSTDMTGCTGKEAEPETPAEPAEPEKKESAGLNPVVLLLVLAVMGGAAFTYFKFIKVSCHYCDSVGFTEIPGFLPDNPLKNAEMMLEDDYGMIDGIINNGPKERTVAQLEQQARSGQPISLMDLAAAAHREERDKKHDCDR